MELVTNVVRLDTGPLKQIGKGENARVRETLRGDPEGRIRVMAKELLSRIHGRSKRDIWEGFVNDKELLATHRVTEEEIRTLKTFVPFGALSGEHDIIFILERIRRAQRRW